MNTPAQCSVIKPPKPDIYSEAPQASATGKVTLRHNSHLYKIGIGRAHARTPIITIVTGLDIRIINHTTGQLLRHLTLDTTRTYQPTQKTKTSRTEGSGGSDVSRHHTVSEGGLEPPRPGGH